MYVYDATLMFMNRYMYMYMYSHTMIEIGPTKPHPFIVPRLFPPLCQMGSAIETRWLILNICLPSDCNSCPRAHVEMKSTKVQTLGAVTLLATAACTDDANIVGL